MPQTQDIHQLCTKLLIELTHKALPESVQGFYYSDSQICMIAINDSIVSNEVLYRSVLAEELGHYFTTIGNRAPVKFVSYTERVEYDRTEQRAIRWAANYLINTERLIQAYRSNTVSSFQDVTSHFMVTDTIAKEKFNSMATERLHWDIDDDRKLILTNLPNIWVYRAL